MRMFLAQYWQWLLGGLAALILGGVQVRLYWHQTKESRLKIDELEKRLKEQAEKQLISLAPDIDIKPTFIGFNYKELILTSKELLVIMNDGRSWVDSNREFLRDRLSSRGKTTRFCFVHPHSPYIKVLIKKNGKLEIAQIDEIHRSFNVIWEIAPKWADVEVRAHNRPSPYCLFLTENVAIVDPYFFFEAGSLPMLVFSSDTELYQAYREDARKLLKEALPLDASAFEIGPLPERDGFS